MFRSENGEDLRSEIFQLKKQLFKANTENGLFKVKIRKLQDEISKKDKQINTLLNPEKSFNFKKILFEKSATFLMNMKERNQQLQRNLEEKDAVIKKLQNKLELMKLYSYKPRKNLENETDMEKNKLNNTKKVESGIKDRKIERSMSWTPEIQSSTLGISRLMLEPNLTNNFKEQYKGLSKDHLLSIIESLKSNRCSPILPSSRKSSPESDLDRIELLSCESPHEEIQQLHLHFLEMLTEVDYLKGTISQLQNNQVKTESVLKAKHDNMDKLAKEIKNLKRPKSSFKNKSKKEIVNIYAANRKRIDRICTNSNKNNDDFQQKKTNTIRKKPEKHVKTVMTQVEKDLLESETEEVKYIEKNHIFITKKTENCNENYEHETFDECDNESVVIT